STGGVITTAKLAIDKIKLNDEYEPYKLSIDELIGGHSGEEIHKERGNANKLLGRILNNLNKSVDIYVSNIKGGTSSNAIPRNSEANILISKADINKAQDIFDELKNAIQDELKIVDENIKINLEKSIEKDNEVFSKENLNSLISFLTIIPNGVQSMSMSIEKLVESSNNVGTIRTRDNVVEIESEIRSCVKSKRIEIENVIENISNVLGFNYSTRDEYPEWNYNHNSIIRNVFLDNYKDLCKEDMKVEAIHAGLETGILMEKIPELDIVSYGPNAYELHNPKEHLNIPSCFKVWDVLTNVLENTINYY
ncbi:MAG: peptidase dimerization domain-containing protein, partial [Paraclostridium sp.]